MNNLIIKKRETQCAHGKLNNIHPLLANLLSSRVSTPDEINQFSLRDLLPFQLLFGIDKAVELIYKTALNKKNIVIVGDFDTDGATSTALMMKAMNGFCIENVHYLIPDRFDDGYGLSESIVDKAIKIKADLIITVDNGISAASAVEFAHQRGIKVIITDHHLIPQNKPNADVIVNPHLSECQFPSKNLAGVGIAFYLVMALRSYLRQQSWFENHGIKEFNLASLLDLVALGTVADVVSLDVNNRILVQQGILRIRAKYCSVGILALMEINKKRPEQLCAQDLGFYVAPKINAAGRMDNMSLGVQLLITDDPIQATMLAEQLYALNDERKIVESTMKEDALSIINNNDFSQETSPNSFVLYQPDFHQGVIGILSSRIRDRFYRPVVSFAPFDDDYLKGSARSIPTIHIRNLFDRINGRYPNLIQTFGGHAIAAGLSIKADNLEQFKIAFDCVLSESIDEQTFQHIIETDGEVPDNCFDYETAMLIKSAVPWGKDFPEPLFEGIFEIRQQSIVGTNHLKLAVKSCSQQSQNIQTLDAIKFNADLSCWPNFDVTKAKILYRLNPNEFRNNQTVNLLIEHIFPLH